jgi:hypothetical protein
LAIDPSSECRYGNVKLRAQRAPFQLLLSQIIVMDRVRITGADRDRDAVEHEGSTHRAAS